jgi:hypothetical protein
VTGTDFNYDDTSHQVIFDDINGGFGSEPLQQASQGWNQLGDDVGITCKSYVQSAIGTILATRQGAAADAAAAAIGAMLPWMDDVTQIATTAAKRAQGQAEHWVRAKNSVPPVPPAPQSASFFGDPTEWMTQKMDWIPGLTTEEEKARQRRQEAAEQARQAMRVYQTSSNGNVDPAPAFTTPQALDGSIGALPLTDPRITTPARAGGGMPAHLLAAHPSPVPQPAAHQPAAHQPAAHQPAAHPPAATVSQLAQGGPAETAGSFAPSPGQWAGNPTSSQGLSPGTLPIGAGLGEATTGRNRPRSARGTAVGAQPARAGQDGGASQAAGFGPRPSTGFDPRPSASAHPSLEEMSGSHGSSGSTTATRGAAGTGYEQPFAGGAGQRGEQDREHRTKYLVHDDSHAIVGDLPPTAPPVIGADY